MDMIQKISVVLDGSCLSPFVYIKFPYQVLALLIHNLQ